MKDDAGELRAYAERRCEDSFERLVRRYIHLLYSVALRRVGGERALAEEVSQSVFLDLARKAGSLPETVVLGGWLHRHTCFVASKAVRGEARRRRREEEAAVMKEPDAGPPDGWERLSPVLDEALDRLPSPDRDAIVLRFYEGREFRRVGEALGISEAAAQKRVSRAVDKLRGLLARQGSAGAVSSAGLASLMGAQAVAAAPANLASAAAAAALAGVPGAGTAATIGGFITMTTMTKLKAGALGALLIGMAVPIGLQHQSIQRLEEEKAALTAQTAQLSEVEELRAENQRLKQAIGSAPNLTGSEFSELLRLRNEVGLLRQRTNELAQLKRQPAPAASGEQLPYPLHDVVSAEKVIFDPQAGIIEKLEALQVLRFNDARSDEIVREMVRLYYTTENSDARADIFRQLHGVATPELKRPLLEALSNAAEHSEVREEAAETLDGYVSDPLVRQWLKHVSTNDPSEKLRDQARRSLARAEQAGI